MYCFNWAIRVWLYGFNTAVVGHPVAVIFLVLSLLSNFPRSCSAGSVNAKNGDIRHDNINSRNMKISKFKHIGNSIIDIRGGSDGLSSMDWRYFLAGGICAATSHGITTPIDVIKTKMQTDPEKYSKGVLQAAKDIVAAEGVGFLLSGLGPTVVGYGLEGALKFGFYETFKVLLSNLKTSKFIILLLASVVAGAIASIVLCPMEETRIKMVGEASWAKENLVSGLARLVKEDGILSSFGGLLAMISKQVPYTMGKQVSFDVAANYIYSIASQFAIGTTYYGLNVKWTISLLSAFFASIVACLSSQPGDMILTATYKGSHGGHGQKSVADTNNSKDFFSIIRSIYKKHGLGGFYLGTQARLAHVASIITTQLVLYDIIKTALGLPITGSH
eukprot:gene14288-19168_t